jgi:SCP-2 sterol transfer family
VLGATGCVARRDSAFPRREADSRTRSRWPRRSSGQVERIQLDPPANTPAYRLTTRGLQLRPVLTELSRWGVWQPPPPGAEQSPAALLLGFSALYDPARVATTTTAVLTIGRESFTLTASTDDLQIEPGIAGDADFRVTGTVAALRATLGKAHDPKPFEDTGELTITGDRASFARLSHCFPAPTPAIATT